MVVTKIFRLGIETESYFLKSQKDFKQLFVKSLGFPHKILMLQHSKIINIFTGVMEEQTIDDWIGSTELVDTSFSQRFPGRVITIFPF